MFTVKPTPRNGLIRNCEAEEVGKFNPIASEIVITAASRLLKLHCHNVTHLVGQDSQLLMNRSRFLSVLYT